MKTLPSMLMRHTVLLYLPASANHWKHANARPIVLTRVHVQFGEAMHYTHSNEEAIPQAELWYDCRLSRPSGLDLVQLFQQAKQAGKAMQCKIGGELYAVSSVELLPDARGRAHHYHLCMGAGRTVY